MVHVIISRPFRGLDVRESVYVGLLGSVGVDAAAALTRPRRAGGGREALGSAYLARRGEPHAGRIVGLPERDVIRAGVPADPLLFPARDGSELLSRLQRRVPRCAAGARSTLRCPREPEDLHAGLRL